MGDYPFDKETAVDGMPKQGIVDGGKEAGDNGGDAAADIDYEELFNQLKASERNSGCLGFIVVPLLPVAVYLWSFFASCC